MTAPVKEDPSHLELRVKPRPVARLNRKALIVIVGGLAALVLLSILYALRKPAAKPAEQIQELHNVERVNRPEGLASLPRDYGSLPKVPQLGAPIGEFGRPILRAERVAGVPELPEKPSFDRDPEEDALRARRLKEQSEIQEAAKAQVFAQLNQRASDLHAPAESSSSLSAKSASDAEDATTAPQLTSASSSQGGTASGASTADQNKQESKQSFIDRKAQSSIYASATLQTPQSPYELIAGTVIPAALLTGIDSDLPGAISATVTANVYDTVTGNFLLVPQGARLQGQYDSQVSYGQRRVLLVWTRLILPDGSSITLDRLPGVDTAGQAGLEDKVDWHWSRIFAGAAVSTLLGAGAELAAPNRADAQGTVIVATRESLQDSINQVGQEITRRNLNIQPTLTERPGLPLRVLVTRDLILKPYGTRG